MDTSHAISLEELARLPDFYRPTLSHDQRWIAFYGNTSGRMELYVVKAESGAQPRQISRGQVALAPRAGFCWTWDTQYIIYAKDHNGDEQHNLWRINVQTGDAEQLTNNPNAQEYPIVVTPDNQSVLVFSNLNGQLQLYRFDLNTRLYKQLTDYPFPVLAFSNSPDGSRIAFINNETPDFKNRDLYVMNGDGSDQRLLLQLKVGSRELPGDWTRDNQSLIVTSDVSGTNRVGIYHLPTEAFRWISPEERDQTALSLSPDETTVLVLDNAHASITVRAYDLLTGAEKPLDLPPGMSSSAAWLDDRRFIVTLNTDTTRQELHLYDMSDNSRSVILSAEYGSIDPALFVRSEYISYTSFDGLEIHALLYRPRVLQPGVKYPALVEAHGGATAQFMRGFNPYAQFLADQGYIVIQPNIRGSTGYGTAFQEMAHMDWGGGNLEDLVYAAKYLQGLEGVDDQRIGIWGGSFGGYMTYLALTKRPDIWKAGVAYVGFTDLFKLDASASKHYRSFYREQIGDPETNADLWYDRSPIHFAHQMTAHLLILHGVNDPRCPIEQARIFRDRLLALGKVEGQDFEYVELQDEGHGSSDAQQKIRSYTLLADYFAQHL